MKKKGLWLTLSLLVLLMIGLTACGGSDEQKEDTAADVDAVKITCENGVMLGKSEEGVTAFKGIPFAKPPVGDLRWKAPQAPDPSDEEIECFDFGYTALQYEWPSEAASSFPKNEDCLTLNIWETEGTAEADKPKPVMVFFHGGAYGWGGTTDPLYDGHNYVKEHEDVIMVTCNYRLGLMGWADFSKIEGGEEYTDVNLGIRDHIAALQWIKKNIGAFGGDPENVTIFGESAGAFSTTALTISPKAKGLFKRAIAESGVVEIRDREDAQEYADYIMEASGAKNMKDLLAISGDEWMKLDEEKWIADECCGTVADGDIIPEKEDVDQAMKEAADSGIELIIGSNQDEWNYFMADMEGETDEEKMDEWVSGMDEVYKEVEENASDDGKAALKELMTYEEDAVAEEYAKDEKVKSALAKSGFMTETWRYQIGHFADRYADAGGDVYMYIWDVPSTRGDMFKSSVHAIELAYVFNNYKEGIYAGEVQEDAGTRIQQSWLNFAKDGNPSIEDAEWQKYTTEDRQTMLMEKDGWKCESDPTKEERELMNRIYGDEPYPLW